MRIKNDNSNKINKHINIIALVTPILMLCNILQKDYGNNIFLNLSNILVIATLFQTICFKLFLFVSNKCNIDKYIDTDDTFDWSLKLMYANLLIGIALMVANIMTKIYSPISMMIYSIIFIVMDEMYGQSSKIYGQEFEYHCDLEEIVIVTHNTPYRTTHKVKID